MPVLNPKKMHLNMGNILRATEIDQNFVQVAADHSGGERRKFELKSGSLLARNLHIR